MTDNNKYKRYFPGRKSFWLLMAGTLLVFGFFFDDVARLLLTDSQATHREPTVLTSAPEVVVTPSSNEPVDSELLDSPFTRAVTEGEQLVLADQLESSTASQANIDNVVASIDDVLSELNSAGSVPGRDALHAALVMLETGRDRLAALGSYSATFHRRECVAGEMRDDERIELKVRHAPFSVYMKWLTGDRGREVLYDADEPDGCMLIRLGGFKGRILPALKIDPYGSRAMRSSRYPITECGLLQLCNVLINFRRGDIAEEKQIDCEMQADTVCEGRKSYFMRLEYRDRGQSEVYRKTDLHIDQETLLPVCIWNYTWPADQLANVSDDETLIEYYQYTNLDLEQNLVTADFDARNPEYRFSR